MKKIMYFAVATTLLCGCSKDNDTPSGSIYGVVTSKTAGEPIIAASVALYTASYYYDEHNGKLLTQTVTGSDGSYEFLNLTEGDYELKITSAGYKVQWHELKVGRGVAKGDVLLEIQPTYLSVVTEIGDIKTSSTVVKINYRYQYHYFNPYDGSGSDDNGDNSTSPHSVGFYYDINSDPQKGTKVNLQVAYSGSSVTQTGLTPNTTYYVQGFATNDLGTEYGNIVSFKTRASDEYAIIGSLMVQTSDAGSAGNYSTAVAVCNENRTSNFSNWRLPTISELGVVHANKSQIGGFGRDWYWSSSSCNAVSTYRTMMYFEDGSTYCDYEDAKVRCVRTLP